jgi:hypothetical protein
MKAIMSALPAVTAAVVVAAATPAAADPGVRSCQFFPGVRSTVSGAYRITVRSCPTVVPVNAPTFWTVKVTTRRGTPIAGRVDVTGGMPEHGHGFLTRPVVTRGSAPGVYRVRLVFAMRGRWVVEYRISERGRRDVARYQLTV